MLLRRRHAPLSGSFFPARGVFRRARAQDAIRGVGVPLAGAATKAKKERARAAGAGRGALELLAARAPASRLTCRPQDAIDVDERCAPHGAHVPAKVSALAGARG